MHETPIIFCAVIGLIIGFTMRRNREPETIRPARVSIDLRNAYICVNCDTVANGSQCFVCGSSKLNYPLTHWIKPVPHE